jgi:hypothetical protein
MRYAWKNDGAGLEVSQPAIDRAGHDLVLEARGVTRHVQLKTSWTDGKSRGQNVHLGLVGKPSGCVVWMLVDEMDMTCQSFLFFGGAPREPLPSLEACRVAKHTRKNGSGTKGERPNLRTVPRARFHLVADVAELYVTLFGSACTPSGASANIGTAILSSIGPAATL